MKETGKITAAEAAAADPKAVKLAPEPNQNSVRYFTDWALPQLENLIDEPNRPLEVWTTIDIKMQKAADAAIRANAPGNAQGALISLDRDGAVRAMVGGKDYVTSNYNRVDHRAAPAGIVVQAVRLSGRARGRASGRATQVVDEPVTINGWSPRNSSGHNSGADGSAHRLRLFGQHRRGASWARKSASRRSPTWRGGSASRRRSRPIRRWCWASNDVRVIDMTRAFASVANKGVAVTPYGITKVTSMGETIYQHEVDRSHVLVAPYVAQEMTDLLQTAVNTGTGRAAQIGRPVAGKTGTTSSNKDGWFLGFSSGLTTGVWMGRDDAKAVPGLQGGTAPARAFAAFMKIATAGRPVEQFDTAVTLPEFQLENESDFGQPDNGAFVDPDGNPIPPDQIAPDDADRRRRCRIAADVRRRHAADRARRPAQERPTGSTRNGSTA